MKKKSTSKSKKAPKKSAAKSAKKTKSGRRWSGKVTEESDALDLEPDIFESDSPRRIALSLKKSAEKSKRRKSSPLQSSMSMLNFYINRAGKNLSASRRKILEKAKDELHAAFERDNKED